MFGLIGTAFDTAVNFVAANNPITATVNALNDGVADFNNLRNAGYTGVGATVVAVGSTLADAVGLGDGGLYDAVAGQDKFRRELSPLERGRFRHVGNVENAPYAVGRRQPATLPRGGRREGVP